MAQTLADNLFDRKGVGMSYGKDLTFADLNPARPLLILNATDGTDDPNPEDSEGEEAKIAPGYGNVFTFTSEEFAGTLGSDLSKFPIADAVMASASFPGAFPYRTMRNFKVKKPSYVHVFDGGNSDNLGLTSIREVIYRHEKARKNGPKTTYIVICVDSYTEPRGARPRDADPRSAVDYVVDTDFFDAVDMLLKNNRYRVLASFMSTEQQNDMKSKATDDEDDRRRNQVKSPQHKLELIKKAATREPDLNRGLGVEEEWEPNDLGDHLVFWHITFRDLYSKRDRHNRKLYNEVNSIATDFKISEEQADQLEEAAHKLVNGDPEHDLPVPACLEKVRSLLAPR